MTSFPSSLRRCVLTILSGNANLRPISISLEQEPPAPLAGKLSIVVYIDLKVHRSAFSPLVRASLSFPSIRMGV